VSDSELIDTFDEMGRHLGVADRRTVHSEGLWHQVFHLLVVARRDERTVVVLQRRAASKAAFPGLLDLSATGHLAAGESPLDGLRELREELGIDVARDHLVPLGVRRIVDETPEGVNRELAHVFLVHDDRRLTAYRPDPAEVDAVVELDVEEGMDLLAGQRESVRCPIVAHDADGVGELVVTVGSLVPEAPLGPVAAGSPPGYWLTLLVMAARSASGDRRLAI
jgi:isopentenyldiphosphate isomerase